MSQPAEKQTSRKIGLLESLARAWSDAGLRWAVCNGLGSYPDGVGRDLDVMVEQADLHDALRITVDRFRESGFTPVPFKLGWIYWVIGIADRGGKVESVQVDLFDHLQWAFSWPVHGVGRHCELESTEPFRVDPAASVGKRIVINALSGNRTVFRRKPHYLELSDAERKVLPKLLESLSGNHEPEVVAAVGSADPERLAEAFGGFRKRVLRRSLRAGRGWIRRVHCAWQKQWSLNIWPQWAVPTIAVQAVDREVEEEICRLLSEMIARRLVFANVIEVRGRPKEIFAGGVRRAWQVLLDFRLGSRFRARKLSAQQFVQIYCGHALVIHLDPARENLKKFPHWMVKAAPRPMLSFYVGDGVDSWVESGEIDAAIPYTGEAEPVAAEIFEAYVARLRATSKQQCRRLGL